MTCIRRYPRGMLDEVAALMAKKYPEMTIEAIAAELGCSAASLRNTLKCPKFQAQRRINRLKKQNGRLANAKGRKRRCLPGPERFDDHGMW